VTTISIKFEFHFNQVWGAQLGLFGQVCDQWLKLDAWLKPEARVKVVYELES
jgi:hypothetical protein